MRKLKIIFLMLFIIFTSFVISDKSFAETYTYGDFQYEKYERYITITKYNGSAENVIVPSTIDGTKVMIIEQDAFRECASLKNVEIPNTVIYIGCYAFYNCENLQKITIPDSIQDIGNFTFYNCKSLQKITIPDGVEDIGLYTFYNCKSLQSITMPDSVESIGAYAFYNCKSLQSMKIPNNVKSLGSYAFYNCEALQDITLLSNVNNIGYGCFLGCDNLTMYVEAGSYAEQYAKENNIPYKLLNDIQLNIPQNVTLSPKYNKITVKWDKVDGADGYQIYRATSKTGTYTLKKTVTSGSTLSYTNTGLTTGKTYYYKVRAYKFVVGSDSCDKVYGSFSTVKSAKTVLDTPTIVSISPKYDRITVKWDKVDGADGYQVYRATSKTGTYILKKTITSGDSLSYTNTGLTTNKYYYYKVRAYRIINDSKVYSSYSDIKSAKTALGIPTINSISPKYDRITVKWDKVDGADGYQVYRATSKTGTYILKKTITSGDSLSYTNTGLTTNKYYYYKVRAYRIINDSKVYSSYSDIKSAKTALGIPTINSISPKYDRITVKWDKVDGADGYQVYRATSQTGTYTLKKTATSGYTLSYTNTGLTTGKTYYYKVRAYKTVNGSKIYSSYSDIKSAKTALDKPFISSCKYKDPTRVSIQWFKVDGADGYQVYRATSETGTYTLKKTVTSGSTLYYTNTGLTEGKSYYYKIKAYKTVNGTKVYSPFSSVASPRSSLKLGNIDCETINITGYGVSGASIEVYNGDTKIGSANVNDRNFFLVKINPPQSAFTKLTIKQSVNGTQVEEVNVYVTFTINKVKVSDTKITGKGKAGANVQAFVGNKQIGTTTKVNSNGRYSISIPKQRDNTEITVKMTSSDITLSRNVTVKCFINPSKITRKNINGINMYSIIAPVDNKDLYKQAATETFKEIVIDPSIDLIEDLPVNDIEKYSLIYMTKFSLICYDINDIDKLLISDKERNEKVLDEVREFSKDELNSLAIKGIAALTIPEVELIYTISDKLIAVNNIYEELQFNLDYDSTDYDLNRIYNKLMQDYVNSEELSIAVFKYNYACNILSNLKDKGDISINSNNEIILTSNGKSVIETLKNDLNKIEMTSLNRLDQPKVLKAVNENQITITGKVPREGITVTAYKDGEEIGSDVSIFGGLYSIEIPVYPAGTTIKLFATGSILFDKEYLYCPREITVTID